MQDLYGLASQILQFDKRVNGLVAARTLELHFAKEYSIPKKQQTNILNILHHFHIILPVPVQNEGELEYLVPGLLEDSVPAINDLKVQWQTVPSEKWGRVYCFKSLPHNFFPRLQGNMFMCVYASNVKKIKLSVITCVQGYKCVVSLNKRCSSPILTVMTFWV